MGGGEHRTGFGDDSAGGDVPAPEYHVLLGLHGGIELYRLLAAVGQLLHQHTVCALGQGCAGHDAGRTAHRQRRSGGISGVELHGHGQGDGCFAAGTGGVGAVQGVAVEGAAVKGRLVHPGRKRPGGNAAVRFVQRDDLRLRPRQSRSGIQHAAQRLRGRAERLFHKKILQMPGHTRPAMAQAGRSGDSYKKAGQKRSGGVLMKNQNASAEYPHIPAKGSLQTVLPMAALRSLPLLQWRQSMESPCVDGRSSFFQIAAFLLREGGGVSPSTLECRLI